ncbi:glucose-6-phosphate isomerase [Neptunomonas marina]|uniref:Glucose-6-phosphate isomerase n=1 Tax=Neptunomonas marina TaxID=1815562 RepID=A0A437Q7U3_9GAMM|nr:glucose-6-phosphate isomerase [Neptunomonas marina]RVU30453.1 glucose-6-phosphate isomerase [Neptunomonas marina]
MTITSSSSWQTLQDHAQQMQHSHLKELLLDESRFKTLSFAHGPLLIDFSKQRIDQHTLKHLVELAKTADLPGWITRLFNGDPINTSEARPALHTALREQAQTSLEVGGHNIIQDVQTNLSRMEKIVERIHSGQWRGYAGEPIDTIVNIGVGGSDLGPYMACSALRGARVNAGRHLKVHFVSSMDGSELADILGSLNPATTLFIVSSKSFTTIDTLSNAHTARKWLRDASGVNDTIINRCHFIGISANPAKMSSWGIADDNQLEFWDWIGGRYSMWSAIGLPIALRIGMDGFREMLQGAHSMDQHFLSAPLNENLPVLLGLIGVWNVNFLDIHAHAILPYDGRLIHLPAYLEQLEMESNGKSVNRVGESLDYRTCPVLWGEVGPNAQHAFYQLLHQGTESVMCDFIVSARRYEKTDNESLRSQHTLTLANCLAQSRILAIGSAVQQNDQPVPGHKQYHGNQPSTTLLLDELTPFSFGSLIALYEHKVFVQSVIWDINPFDQWGVELGKTMATSLLKPLQHQASDSEFDPSTHGLMRHIHQQQERS